MSVEITVKIGHARGAEAGKGISVLNFLLFPINSPKKVPRAFMKTDTGRALWPFWGREEWPNAMGKSLLSLIPVPLCTLIRSVSKVGNHCRSSNKAAEILKSYICDHLTSFPFLDENTCWTPCLTLAHPCFYLF